MVKITAERAAKRAQRLVNMDYASDFYKDVYGIRPWNHWYRPIWPKDHLRAYRTAKRRLEWLKSTPEGRAALRADGWDV